jgi:hypothetical protein
VCWLFALSDKPVGAAIAAARREPERRWTVAAPALEIGVSGCGQLAGDAIECLRRSRMRVAGRSLPRGEPVGAIARSLGQESDSAFSNAGKRRRAARLAITRARRPLHRLGETVRGFPARNRALATPVLEN